MLATPLTISLGIGRPSLCNELIAARCLQVCCDGESITGVHEVHLIT